ncbi:uncharacterized protein PV07_08597 [Cladophialophora immunda]|uniref:Uncharacterized protein n=1 Tax=Cladophialophora immunda TaxID=569365 RepID=A0A0D2CPD0_9EURO|nr:uncharacterized protein PV07_08597 [Cladophialophora immunda]KIW25424.1 hypothetical protein PV07_08597 [Cladophialophora immunda]
MSKFIPIITGKETTTHRSGCESRFSNFESFIKDMSAAQPALYHGAKPSAIHQHVRSDLNRHVIPTSSGIRPAAPHFFMELKGKDGLIAESEVQVIQDGEPGAVAIDRLQNYCTVALTYDNIGYTLTTTYEAANGTLSIFAVQASLYTIRLS